VLSCVVAFGDGMMSRKYRQCSVKVVGGTALVNAQSRAAGVVESRQRDNREAATQDHIVKNISMDWVLLGESTMLQEGSHSACNEV